MATHIALTTMATNIAIHPVDHESTRVVITGMIVLGMFAIVFVAASIAKPTTIATKRNRGREGTTGQEEEEDTRQREVKRRRRESEGGMERW